MYLKKEKRVTMSIWEKIKRFLGINQPKQIEAPKEESNFREEIAVSEEYLEVARDEQMKEKNREFQLMFAIKNICGKGMNMFGNEDVTRVLQNRLKNYGYGNELNLDNMDIEILSRVNMNLNNRKSAVLTEYITNSDEQAYATAILVNRVKEQAIQSAKNFGYNEQMAGQFIPTDVISSFEETIEEQSLGNEIDG